MTKATAVIAQLATADKSSMQQMVLFANKAAFRRTLTATSRTQWRFAPTGPMDEWVDGYLGVTSASPTPMLVSHGLTLIEVNPDEVEQAEKGALDRKVQLRYARVIDAMDAATPFPAPTDRTDSTRFVQEWIEANTDDDNAWIDRHIHAAGTAKDPAPAAPAPVVPEPPIKVKASAHGWVYPEVKGGYVVRPNGERYKVRTLEGIPDVQIMRESREDREHTFLFGEPGTGKTALLDAAFGSNMVTMLGTEDVEVPDFIGTWVRRAGTPVWVDGALTEAMDRGVPLFIDECGVIFPKVMTVVYSVMDGRDEIRITSNPDRGIIKAKPGFVVYGATNPHAPGVRISEALTSRFEGHIEVTTDYAMMRELGVDDALVTAAENMEARRQTGAATWAPQARELLRTQRMWAKRGVTYAVRNLISSAPEDQRKKVAESLGAALGHTPMKGLVL